MKLETAHSTSLSSNQGHDYIYVDYALPTSWKMKMYGHVGERSDVETWLDDPGNNFEKFKMYNTIMFGDSLFTPSQLKFQNISKNKDMFDILDIGEVDGCYYGLFKDEINSTDEHPLYTVFKTAPEYKYRDGTSREGVVSRLPYKVVNPKLYVTKGGLYSLYVVEELDNGRKQLREVSVPDSDLYPYRTIPLQDVVEWDPIVEGEYAPDHLEIYEMVMSKFAAGDPTTSFFVLSNWPKGFHKVSYINDFEQASIDDLTSFNEALRKTFAETILAKHMADKHTGAGYFGVVAGKVNQAVPGFNTFSLVPAEFGETQDVGVIPASKVDDTDIVTDHRDDSI